ncbi:hypothetical protein Tco_1251738 [Tanacetum coccineum]
MAIAPIPWVEGLQPIVFFNTALVLTHIPKTKRRRTKESESSKKPSTTKETQKGKAPTKGSKTGKFTSAKEPVEEPTIEAIMDDASDDLVHDDEQPQATSKPKTSKTLNPRWLK